MTFYVYILKCKDDTLYTGYTTNLKKRLGAHNGESNILGAKYTSGRRPVAICYVEEHSTRSAAQKREYAIKQLTKPAKLKLISARTLNKFS